MLEDELGDYLGYEKHKKTLVVAIDKREYAQALEKLI